jgi:hypothetical protein
MKNRMICSIFFIFSVAIFSPKKNLSGTVKDSLQNPLSYANVLAKPKDVNKKN